MLTLSDQPGTFSARLARKVCHSRPKGVQMHVKTCEFSSIWFACCCSLKAPAAHGWVVHQVQAWEGGVSGPEGVRKQGLSGL